MLNTGGEEGGASADNEMREETPPEPPKAKAPEPPKLKIYEPPK